MMKQLAIAVIAFIISIFSVLAQTNTSADTILDRATAKIKAAKGINVSFSLTRKSSENNLLLSTKGYMKIKGAKYYINQQENEIFCDGVQIWNYDGRNEVTVAKVDDEDNEFSPQQILTGFNKKDFDIKLLSSAGINYQIQLTPIDKRQNFKQIIIYINKSTNLVSRAAVTDKMNSVTAINFTNISLNVSFANSQFVFDASKHPGVEIINN